MELTSFEKSVGDSEFAFFLSIPKIREGSDLVKSFSSRLVHRSRMVKEGERREEEVDASREPGRREEERGPGFRVQFYDDLALTFFESV